MIPSRSTFGNGLVKRAMRSHQAINGGELYWDFSYCGSLFTSSQEYSMDKAELKKRAELADERVINLFKRYPLVGIIVSTVGMLIGIGICKLFFS